VENGDGNTNTVDYIDFKVKILDCHDRYEHETTSDEEDDSDFDPDAYDEDEDEDLDVGNEPPAANGSSGPVASAPASPAAPPIPAPSQAQGASVAAPAPQHHTSALEASPAVPSAAVPAPTQAANQSPNPALQTAAPSVRQRPLDLTFGTPNCLSGCNFAFAFGGTQTPYYSSDHIRDVINDYGGSYRSYRDLQESPREIDFLILGRHANPDMVELARVHEITPLTQSQLFHIIDIMPPSSVLRTQFANGRSWIVAVIDGRRASVLAWIQARGSQEPELHLITSSVTASALSQDPVLPPIEEILRRLTRPLNIGPWLLSVVRVIKGLLPPPNHNLLPQGTIRPPH
jgi:hypothetical protein